MVLRAKVVLQRTDENLSNWFSHGPDALDPHEIIEPINWKRRNCFRPILLLLGKEILITAALNRNSREYCRIRINRFKSWRDVISNFVPSRIIFEYIRIIRLIFNTQKEAFSLSILFRYMISKCSSICRIRYYTCSAEREK